MLRLLLLLTIPFTALAQLQGVIDLHVHCAPDSGPRSIDALETARMAQRHNMRALLFKNHYTHTASLAYLVSQAVPGIESYGGIALNRSVGGINPPAIEHMVRTTGALGRVVWMPTFDSEHYHRTVEPNPNHVPVSSHGELLPEVQEVLALMSELNLALATGHSSPAESLLLIREAKRVGVGRILVTHPMLPLVGMSVEIQKEAAQLGALLEYPAAIALPSGDLSVEAYAAAIREVGPAHVIVTSDLGQPLNPVHTDGLIWFFDQLRSHGFTGDEIGLMTKHNPARYLALE